MTPRFLVLACGNPLRQDDGAAWEVARRATDVRQSWGVALEVVTCMQYLPELAEALSQAEGVVFIDASVNVRPGTARLNQVESEPAGAAALTHHLGPAELMSLAQSLYGSAPAWAYLVEIGAAEFGLSETVSARVEVGIERGAGLLRMLLDQFESERAWSADAVGVPARIAGEG